MSIIKNEKELLDFIKNSENVYYIPNEQISAYDLCIIIKKIQKKMTTSIENCCRFIESLSKQKIKYNFFTDIKPKELNRFQKIYTITSDNISRVVINTDQYPFYYHYPENKFIKILDTSAFFFPSNWLQTINKNINKNNFKEVNVSYLEESLIELLSIVNSYSKKLNLIISLDCNKKSETTIKLKHKHIGTPLEPQINDGLFRFFGTSIINHKHQVYLGLTPELNFTVALFKDNNLDTVNKYKTPDSVIYELLKKVPLDIKTLHPFFQQEIKEFYHEDKLSLQEKYQEYNDMPIELQKQIYYINNQQPANLYDYIKECEEELQNPHRLIAELLEEINTNEENILENITYQIQIDENPTINFISSTEENPTKLLQTKYSSKINLISLELSNLSKKYNLPFSNGEIDIEQFKIYYENKIAELNQDIEKKENIDRDFNANHPNSVDHYLELSKQNIINAKLKKSDLVLKQSKIDKNYQHPLFTSNYGLYQIEGKIKTDLSIATNITINKEALQSCNNFVTIKPLKSYIENYSDEILKSTPIATVTITRHNQYTK